MCVVCLYKHVGLQSGEISRVMPALPDLHVQQVGVYGRVVRLQQPALDGLGCKNRKDAKQRQHLLFQGTTGRKKTTTKQTNSHYVQNKTSKKLSDMGMKTMQFVQ